MSEPIATWASSQSIFQLGVAVNLAVSAIFVLFDSPDERHRSSLVTLDSDLKRLQQEIEEITNTGPNLNDGPEAERMAKASKQFRAFNDKLANFTDLKYIALGSMAESRTELLHWMKTVCYVCAIICMALLLVSAKISLNGGGISDALYYLAALCVVPTFAMMGCAIWTSWATYKKFKDTVAVGANLLNLGVEMLRAGRDPHGSAAA